MDSLPDLVQEFYHAVGTPVGVGNFEWAEVVIFNPCFAKRVVLQRVPAILADLVQDFEFFSGPQAPGPPRPAPGRDFIKFAAGVAQTGRI